MLACLGDVIMASRYVSKAVNAGSSSPSLCGSISPIESFNAYTMSPAYKCRIT